MRLDRFGPQFRHVTKLYAAPVTIQSVLHNTLCIDNLADMNDGEIDELDPRQLARVVSQADKLVASGRLTPEEADRLRAAPDHSSALQVVRDIRARHTSERLDAAVAEGATSKEEADTIREQIRGGEHSRALHSNLARFRLRRRKRTEPADDASPGEADEE